MGSNKKWNPAPDYVVALLSSIDNELCRIMWNKYQEQYDSPFCNTGNNFECDLFEVAAYDWDDTREQEYNFWYKPADIKISWYKYLGRGTRVYGEYSADEYIKMFDDCIKFLRKWENDFLNEF